MSTHACPVVPVVLEKHNNADSLSIVKIKGFTYVARTEDWITQPLGVWIEPDMVVPADRPEFAFLEKSHRLIENSGVKGYRIKVKRLRGIMSMGLMIPAPEGSKEGDDFMSHFGIVRYEPPIPLSTFGEATKSPPGTHYCYDVENAYNFSHLFVEGEEVVITEKIHGCLKHDTKVLLENGEKLISEVVVGDKVICYDTTLDRFSLDVVTDISRKQTNKKWVKLSFDCGRMIECTEDHLFLTDTGYVAAKDLNEQHDIKGVM